ncbi:hypothetical protein [Streptomyces kanamyceticus]|uniref:Uncharacterized protein n=1 Tax=Streptomyces kanamyceticus TaxID=1967 RepID=A0A5J6G6X5_STRKN|nr:hypothetical protein [Streptomyces kanamyceticus]QEU90452.1 hypothetical protein CP970_05575 [Streptomyces kanamyceticus]
MFHDGSGDEYGLGDEELMTVQGLDGHDGYGGYEGYGAYAGYGCPMCGYGDGNRGQGDELGQYEDMGQYEDLGHVFLPNAPRTATCVPGEVRRGRDGQLYAWVEGHDGLGSPVGFWSLLPAIASAVLPLAAKYLPQVVRAFQGRPRPAAPQVMPMPPAPQASADEGDELSAYGADEEDLSLAADEDLDGPGDIDGGIEGYVRERRARTRAFRRPTQAPELWRPLW